jgi:hypothetical protein
MTYRFKRFQELAWFAGVSAGVFALEVLVRFDPDTITSWETWAVSLGGGMLRAAAGAVLAAMTKPA